MERKTAIKALVGSHNYNLATPESDKDYKVFVLPTFEDLYKGNMYSNQSIGEKEDLDVHDIRKLSNLFFKSNINFIEVLYSKELIIPKEISVEQIELIRKLLSKREDIVRMNLPHLFNACGGMYINKMKLLEKGTEGTQHLVDEFGYDTKQALHAYRVLNFIDRFAQTDFNDFFKAMTYSGEEKSFMLEIKRGFFELENFRNFITFYHDSKFKTLKNKYHSFKPNQDLKEEIDDIIMQLVKNSLLN
jgi:uncharacterized protein